MELEYKWKIPEKNLGALAAFFHGLNGRLSRSSLRMAATYYDTAEGTLRKNGAAIRLRKENDLSVFCMKRTVSREGAQARREEYETEAETVSEGLKKLAEEGGPKDFCAFLSNQEFCVIAVTDFIRNCYLFELAGPEPFTAELAVDVGKLGNARSMENFEELELEFKSGDEQSFQRFAEKLQADFSLVPQPLSKLARAINA